MSNARSPREVCSTTIGTRGLMAFALFLLLGRNPSGPGVASRDPEDRSNGPLALQLALGAGRPDLRGLLLGLFLGRPELLAGLRLLGGDGLRGLHQQVHGLPHGDVLAQDVVAPLLLGSLERAPERVLVHALRAARGDIAKRLERLLVGHLDARVL